MTGQQVCVCVCLQTCQALSWHRVFLHSILLIVCPHHDHSAQKIRRCSIHACEVVQFFGAAQKRLFEGHGLDYAPRKGFVLCYPPNPILIIIKAPILYWYPYRSPIELLPSLPCWIQATNDPTRNVLGIAWVHHSASPFPAWSAWPPSACPGTSQHVNVSKMPAAVCTLVVCRPEASDASVFRCLPMPAILTSHWSNRTNGLPKSAVHPSISGAFEKARW